MENLEQIKPLKHRHELTKLEQKLQQRLNRISNLIIGNERIWALDRIAMEMEVDASLLSGQAADESMSDEDRSMVLERANLCSRDALFIRRLQYDLGKMHVAVKGDTNRRGGKYDQENWQGERP